MDVNKTSEGPSTGEAVDENPEDDGSIGAGSLFGTESDPDGESRVR